MAETIIDLQDADHADGEENPWELIELGDKAPAPQLLVSVNQPFLYNAIARELGGAANVVNLHLIDPSVLEGAEASDLLDYAETAAEMIDNTARGRPVMLIGQCVDGSMALLIAEAMSKAGKAPRQVAMIDSWHPNGVDDTTPLRRKINRNKTRARRWARYIGQRLRGELSWTEFLSKNRFGLRLLERLGRVEPETDAEKREWRTNRLLVGLMDDVKFPSYTGEALMFRTASQPQSAHERFFGWTGVLGPDTAIYDVHGWHEDALLKEGIGRIAGVLLARSARQR